MGIIKAYNSLNNNGYGIGELLRYKSEWSEQSENGFINTYVSTNGVVTKVQIIGSNFVYSENKPIGGIVESATLSSGNELIWTLEGIEPTPWNAESYTFFDHAMRDWLKNDDFFIGTSGRNNFVGYDGDDVFYGAGGPDVFSGGNGLDMAELDGNRSDYKLTKPGGSLPFFLQGYVGPNKLFTSLKTDAERFKFADVNVAVDMDLNEGAGAAVRLIGAVAGKKFLEDKNLVGEIISYADNLSIAELAQILVNNGVVAGLAGSGSDEAVISLLYKNIVGAVPTADELKWNIDFMHESSISQAQVLELVVNLDATAQSIGITGLAESGIEYYEFG